MNEPFPLFFVCFLNQIRSSVSQSSLADSLVCFRACLFLLLERNDTKLKREKVGSRIISSGENGCLNGSPVGLLNQNMPRAKKAPWNTLLTIYHCVVTVTVRGVHTCISCTRDSFNFSLWISSLSSHLISFTKSSDQTHFRPLQLWPL